MVHVYLEITVCGWQDIKIQFLTSVHETIESCLALQVIQAAEKLPYHWPELMSEDVRLLCCGHACGRCSLVMLAVWQGQRYQFLIWAWFFVCLSLFRKKGFQYLVSRARSKTKLMRMGIYIFIFLYVYIVNSSDILRAYAIENWEIQGEKLMMFLLLFCSFFFFFFFFWGGGGYRKSVHSGWRNDETWSFFGDFKKYVQHYSLSLSFFFFFVCFFCVCVYPTNILGFQQNRVTIINSLEDKSTNKGLSQDRV